MSLDKYWNLGIDPGVHGALALCSPTDVLRVWDMPNYQEVLTTGKKRFSIDIPELIEIYKFIQRMSAGDDTKIIAKIEKVQAYGKQSAPAAFNFGYSAAIPRTLCEAFGWEVRLISPVSWKRYHMLQATDKDAARVKVLREFPSTHDILKRKKDVDRADAILIAYYKERLNAT